MTNAAVRTMIFFINLLLMLQLIKNQAGSPDFRNRSISGITELDLPHGSLLLRHPMIFLTQVTEDVEIFQIPKLSPGRHYFLPSQNP